MTIARLVPPAFPVLHSRMRTTRRRFLASLATISVAPNLLRAREAEPVVVGEGSHRYRFNDRWAKLPPQIRWGLTHGVVVDRERNVHVFHTSRPESPSKDCVVVFDAQGNFVRSWGEQFFNGAERQSALPGENTDGDYGPDRQRDVLITEKQANLADSGKDFGSTQRGNGVRITRKHFQK